MVHRASDVLGLGILVITLIATPVAAAEDDAEFAFNLFSDVAPILALFGEQFARQFLSESLTWLDHLIFAMVPLGIITAVTGAIRVQGPHIAKAFIGRARENRALVEFELMSSTSHEVGEAFNGRGIVRVMGKPKIAEFLIFPNEYEAAEAFYNLKDEEQQEPKEVTKHALCGIHSFDSVIQSDHGMMRCDHYHSYSYKVIHLWLKALLKRVTVDIEQGPSEEQPKKAALESAKGLGPPNLQLNFSSDHVDTYRYRKRNELIVTAILAVAIQIGLLVLSGTTALYQPLQKRIGSAPKDYGLPCYLAGSILLSLGVGVCSYAVERNTTEYVWTILKNHKDSEQESKQERKKEAKSDEDLNLYPHLIFVQKSQVVNDQAFGAFVMLAGPKRQIIASARNEASATNTHKDEYKTRKEKRWELITVGAAVTAGLGFISQFMGLRGLTYPCSIAQIGAIVVMTLLRATIRRRMGREPANCEAFAEYELDYLAMRIVFNPNFRGHLGPLQGREDWDGTAPGDACFWEVKLPQSKKFGPGERYPVTRTDSIQNSSRQKGGMKSKGWTDGEKLDTTPTTATSEQLIRVRKRLGDLCRWKSKASDAALTLCRSIEHFLDIFFPPKESNGRSFSWPIEAWHGDSTDSVESETERATVVLPISCEQGEWNIDMGKVEAILSLWMASIEAESKRERKKKDKDKTQSSPQTATLSKKQSDWRRSGGASSNRHSFYRILGQDDKDGVLKRDLSWWIGGRFTIQGRPRPGNDSEDTDDSDDSDDTEDTDDNMRALDEGAKEPGVIDIPEFTICFNRDAIYIDQNDVESREGEDVKEIGLEGEAPLATILVQHLFTDFVWTISKYLPENCLPFGSESMAKEVGIEGRDRFEPDFPEETWYLPRLSHIKLTELIRQIETCGLGTTMDIQLCIIPALSFVDRLPNQAMLQLMPPIGKDTAWVTIARCYNSLMKMNMRAKKAETFCLTAIVYAMDFLYIAHLPYDTVLKPPRELKEELEKLVATLSSSRYQQVVGMLVPFHNLQGRRAAFDSIYRQYKENEDVADGCLGLYQTPNVEMGEEYPKSVFGFSESHQKTYNWLRGRGPSGVGLTRKEAVARDIFGWTPIHYSCVFNQSGRDRESIGFWWDDMLQDRQSIKIHKQLDRFKRSPVHIAAANGLDGILERIFNLFIREKNEIWSAIQATGTDGMTPMHWAALSTEPRRLETLIKNGTSTGKHTTDIWGREPIHIAARLGHEEVVGAILKTNAWSLSTDSLGRNPVGYVLTHPPSQDAAENQTGVDEKTEEKGKKDDKDQNPHIIRDAQRLRILDEFASRKPLWRDDGGQGFLHYAAGFTEGEGVVKKLVEGQNCDPALADSNGRTALHPALEHNNLAAFLYLSNLVADRLEEMAGAERSLLIDACQSGRTPFIPRILEMWPEDLNRGDSRYDQPPLSWAIEFKHNDIVKILVSNSDTDLNQSAEQWSGHTPLHVAVGGRNTEALALLLDQPSNKIDINKRNTENQTPLKYAIQLKQADSTKLLLLHPQTPDTDRRRHLGDILKFGGPAFQSIILEMFEHIITNDLLTAEDLSSFIAESAVLDDPTHFEAFMMAIIRGRAWDMVQNPYHLAVQANSAKIIAKLMKNCVDPCGMDEDDWSLEYLANRFGRTELLKGLGDDLLHRQEPTTYPRPETLLWDGRHGSVSIDACNGPDHTNCTGIANVHVAEDTEKSRVSIRTKECISPSSSLNYFYFEITVVKDSVSKELGLGFRRRSTSDDRMPGLDAGSWAWHGDDGALFIESVSKLSIWSYESLRPFKMGDVAGVGLDFETGQPFCTLNGTRLSMGHSLKKVQDRNFHLGKLYPCVGFQVGKAGQGLHFEVNFGGSPTDHPFRYKGPYVGKMEE